MTLQSTTTTYCLYVHQYTVFAFPLRLHFLLGQYQVSKWRTFRRNEKCGIAFFARTMRAKPRSLKHFFISWHEKV